MKLNHLHLTVTDVTAAAEFLERYIGLRRVQSRAKSEGFVVLFDDEDLALTLMKAGHAEEVRYHGHFHIDFLQANDEQVDKIIRRMRDDGFDVEPPQRHHALV